MYSSNPMSDLERVKRAFEDRGISIAEWARQNGFSSALTYQVLAGRKKCLRGQSHAIAVSLGLKSGSKGDMADLAAELLRSPSSASPANIVQPRHSLSEHSSRNCPGTEPHGADVSVQEQSAQ